MFNHFLVMNINWSKFNPSLILNIENENENGIKKSIIMKSTRPTMLSNDGIYYCF